MSKVNIPFKIDDTGKLSDREQRTYDAEVLSNIQLIETSLSDIAIQLTKLNEHLNNNGGK